MPEAYTELNVGIVGGPGLNGFGLINRKNLLWTKVGFMAASIVKSETIELGD